MPVCDANIPEGNLRPSPGGRVVTPPAIAARLMGYAGVAGRPGDEHSVAAGRAAAGTFSWIPALGCASVAAVRGHAYGCPGSSAKADARELILLGEVIDAGHNVVYSIWMPNSRGGGILFASSTSESGGDRGDSTRHRSRRYLMDAQVPLVLALDDPGAAPGVAGGKGASLARLARAGFPVPPGFHVTTSAYLDFIGRGGLREPVLAAMSAVDGSDAATFAAAATRIGDLFAGQPVPAPTAAAIAHAYACLGDDVPVAVRSSAMMEDLPGMSAAGQHDTYLNIRGEAAVLDAVKRCWASLWSARAIGYRARRGAGPGEVSIAVVVQQTSPTPDRRPPRRG
jgi:hypothetical protein